VVDEPWLQVLVLGRFTYRHPFRKAGEEFVDCLKAFLLKVREVFELTISSSVMPAANSASGGAGLNRL